MLRKMIALGLMLVISMQTIGCSSNSARKAAKAATDNMVDVKPTKANSVTEAVGAIALGLTVNVVIGTVAFTYVLVKSTIEEMSED